MLKNLSSDVIHLYNATLVGDGASANGKAMLSTESKSGDLYIGLTFNTASAAAATATLTIERAFYKDEGPWMTVTSTALTVDTALFIDGISSFTPYVRAKIELTFDSAKAISSAEVFVALVGYSH